MLWATMRNWLLPGSSVADEGFHQEILSAAGRGIRVVAAAEAAAAVIGFAGPVPPGMALAVLVLAVATFAITRLSAAYPHTRTLVGISAAAASAILVRSPYALESSVDYTLSAVICIVLAVVVAVPLVPLQTLCMGIAIVGVGLNTGHPLFLATLGLAATAISSTLMSLRISQYQHYLHTMHTLADLRDSQSKAMREESSGTMVRMTAALAHELSSPIGVLSCGIETFLRLCARQAAEKPGPGQEQIESVVSALRSSLRDSVARLRTTVQRIQRLTSLDEAVAHRVNLNDLATEAVSLMKAQSPEGTLFELDLKPLPDVTCKAEQIVSVLCSVLDNSFQALHANSHGRIVVSTGRRDSRLELKIEDNGCGIPAKRLAHIFDPRFQVADGRVSTGNWSLFASRQYMRENGGDIRIESIEGEGTTVCLTLVCLTLHVAS